MFTSSCLFVPSITYNKNIIHKTIVFSDTLMFEYALDNNLIISYISNISEYSLENCLKKILDTNPDILFNTIQYSKNDKRVYFYTDKPVNKSVWEKGIYIKNQILTDTKEILEEIKKVITQENNQDSYCISLYEVSRVMKSQWLKYNSMKKSYENRFNYLGQEKFGKNSFISIYDFDYQRKEFSILFNHFNEFDKIVFAKKDGDLYIKNSESLYGEDVFVLLSDYLSELYDEFMQYSEFKQQESSYINSVNSKFLIDIDCYDINIFVDKYKSNFELTLYNYINEYKYQCNSNCIINALKNNEDKLFKKIFLNIEDCPKWSQSQLYQIRQKQLINEAKLANKMVLKRKILSWIKK